jgi:CubicO group peptidase (beta-lactamase class C family)
LAARLSGERFEGFVRDHLFVPLHMNSATYFLSPDATQSLSKGYQNDGLTPIPCWHAIYRPGQFSYFAP